jgi:esterase/lipase
MNILHSAKLPALLLFSHFFYSLEAIAFDLERLDKDLKASEANYSDIVNGTQKKVTWFAESGKRTAISIVYLHGFSATHKELSPMTEQLAEKLQANVFYSRLSGHGRSDDAMAEATKLAWKKDAREAYEIGSIIGERVILVGTSTGATLATWLSAQPFADKLLGNVLISPNFAIKNNAAWILKNPLSLWLVKQLNGAYRSFEPLNDFHAMYWTERYPLDALVPMLELLDEVDELDKSKINTPLLIVYSPLDHVIDVEKVLEIADQFSDTQVTLVPFSSSTDPAQHVLVGRGSTAGDEVQQQVDNMLDILVPYIEQLKSTSGAVDNLSLPTL